MDTNHNDPTNTDCLEVDCFLFVEVVGEYVDGELDAVSRQAVEDHVGSCEHCRDFLASYHSVIDTAASLKEPEAPLPVAVQNRLREALNQRLGISLPLIA